MLVFAECCGFLRIAFVWGNTENKIEIHQLVAHDNGALSVVVGVVN